MGASHTTYSNDIKLPPIMKQSRTKIWIRTGIFTVFAILFGLTLYRDIILGNFKWTWAFMVFVPCLGVGFWMSRLVPMQVHSESRIVTLSFDRVYFILIFFLVIIKAVTGNLLGLTILADVIICIILGLMSGRLSGICLRVHALKNNMVINRSQRDKLIL